MLSHILMFQPTNNIIMIKNINEYYALIGLCAGLKLCIMGIK